MMKRILLGSFGLLAIAAQPAAAADMPVKAPVVRSAVAAMPFNWSGCYIGAHAGGGWGDKAWFDDQPPVKFAEHDVSGWLVGGQVGCDIQAGAFVFGIEGQAAWADIDGGAANIFSAAFTSNSRIEFVGTVTGRIGYAWDRMLLYAKGGGAWVHDEHWQIALLANSTELNRGEAKRWGWTAGAGLEWAFAANWSGKIEYNYMDFGRRRVLLSGLDNADIEIDQRLHTVKVGLNYRFAIGPTPVVARY
jgi:outer membrane immunogenic protein